MVNSAFLKVQEGLGEGSWYLRSTSDSVQEVEEVAACAGSGSGTRTRQDMLWEWGEKVHPKSPSVPAVVLHHV